MTTIAPNLPAASTTTPSPTIPATPTATTTTSTARVTFWRLVAAEWLKFRTVGSNLTALAGAGVAAISLGLLFSWLADTGEGPARFATDGLALSLGGFDLAQIIVAILGVSLVAGEYQNGLIRSWFAAAPGRLQVLGAKVGVYSALAFVVTLVSAAIAFTAGQALLPDTMSALALTDDGVLQALGGTAFYAACIAAIGVGLGFILRSTATGAGVVVSTLLIAPLMIGLLPSSIADPIGKILPSNAAAAVTGLGGAGTELLSTGGGLLVLGAWVAATLAGAALVLRRRDA